MIELDCRGMRCPWPALRLARALRDGADAVTVLSDDARAPAELTTTAQAAGAAMTGNAPRFVITRG